MSKGFFQTLIQSRLLPRLLVPIHKLSARPYYCKQHPYNPLNMKNQAGTYMDTVFLFMKLGGTTYVSKKERKKVLLSQRVPRYSGT